MFLVSVRSDHCCDELLRQCDDMFVSAWPIGVFPVSARHRAYRYLGIDTRIPEDTFPLT